jgi:hypothetical protein
MDVLGGIPELSAIVEVNVDGEDVWVPPAAAEGPPVALIAGTTVGLVCLLFLASVLAWLRRRRVRIQVREFRLKRAWA